MRREYPRYPVAAVGAVILRREMGTGESQSGLCSVLLVRRAQPPLMGEWSLPGGVLELGERLRDGLVREIREETGLIVEPLALVDALDHIVVGDGTDTVDADAKHVTNDSVDVRVRFHYVLIDFVCRVQSGSVMAASDALEACWLGWRDIEERAGFALSGEAQRVIEKAFRMVDEGLVTI